jgi:hypothetical protein
MPEFLGDPRHQIINISPENRQCSGGGLMKEQIAFKTKSAMDVLSIDTRDIPPFVRDCVNARSLSCLVSELNQQMLFGAQDEKEEARKALAHLGFI